MIDQEFVKYVITALVNKPEEVKVERTVDERGVLLTLHVAEEDLGRVIGRKGTTAQSLRTLLRALGSKNEAHYNLRIMDNDQPSGSRPRMQSVPKDQDQNDDNDFASNDAPVEDAKTEEEAPVVEDSLDKTKKEIDELSDDLL